MRQRSEPLIFHHSCAWVEGSYELGELMAEGALVSSCNGNTLTVQSLDLKTVLLEVSSFLLEKLTFIIKLI